MTFLFFPSCLQQVIEVMREWPQLILFLDMYNEMQDNSMWPYRRQSLSPMANAASPGNKKRTIGTQTELHPIPYDKDPKYTFSIWEQRRRVLQMANLLSKQTRSTQSHESAFRSSVAAQTVTLVDRAIAMAQTK